MSVAERITRDPPFISRLLRQELVPSMGCTEPAALALCAAAAAQAAGGTPRAIRLSADQGTYKNALSVGLPGTDCKGPALAAAAGAVIADPGAGLAILGKADAGIWAQARNLVDGRRIRVIPQEWREVRIEATVDGRSVGESKIQGRHDRLVETTRDGKCLDLSSGGERPSKAAEIGDDEITRRLNGPDAFLQCLDQLDGTDLEHVAKGVDMNRQLALPALREGIGWSLGRAFDALSGGSNDPYGAAKSWVSAAIEARMDGEALPVMTSGGSGNSGITVSLGIWSAATALGSWSDEELYTAIALGHLVNIAVKARIGRVGPLCGGAIASSMGVGCGLAWIMGGDKTHLDRVMRHLADTTAGTICDGAKPGCALKVATGLTVAIDAARMAVADEGRIENAGLGGISGRQSLNRLEQLAHRAFANVDHHLIEILTDDTRRN